MCLYVRECVDAVIGSGWKQLLRIEFSNFLRILRIANPKTQLQMYAGCFGDKHTYIHTPTYIYTYEKNCVRWLGTQYEQQTGRQQ